MECWRFLNYIGPTGTDYFDDWLTAQDDDVKAKIITRLQLLRFEQRISRPHWAMLQGPGKGLIEVRVYHRNVQYRPLCYQGPDNGQITFLAGAIEKGDALQPKNVLKTAHQRRKACDESHRTSEQDY